MRSAMFSSLMLVPALLSCAVSKTDLLDDTATAPSTTVTDTTTIPTTTTTTTIQTTTTTQTTNVTELPIYTLEVLLTVDDAWDLYVDGVFIDAQSGWSFADTSTSVVNLNTDGPHVVAVHGYDQQQIISGFTAQWRGYWPHRWIHLEGHRCDAAARLDRAEI